MSVVSDADAALTPTKLGGGPSGGGEGTEEGLGGRRAGGARPCSSSRRQHRAVCAASRRRSGCWPCWRTPGHRAAATGVHGRSTPACFPPFPAPRHPRALHFDQPSAACCSRTAALPVDQAHRHAHRHAHTALGRLCSNSNYRDDRPQSTLPTCHLLQCGQHHLMPCRRGCAAAALKR